MSNRNENNVFGRTFHIVVALILIGALAYLIVPILRSGSL